jgi:hypothetical protein
MTAQSPAKFLFPLMGLSCKSGGRFYANRIFVVLRAQSKAPSAHHNTTQSRINAHGLFLTFLATLAKGNQNNNLLSSPKHRRAAHGELSLRARVFHDFLLRAKFEIFF